MDTTTPKDQEITDDDLNKIDTELLEVELLYKSRCVKMPPYSNVTVRDIDDQK